MQPIVLSSTDYDPEEALGALRLKDVFGWSTLSPSEKEKAVSWAANQAGLSLENEPVGGVGWTLEELVDCRYHSPFAQGPPLQNCTVPDCDGLCSVIAMQEFEHAGELIWPENSSDTQTIWQICEKCNCVTATNLCT